MEKSAEKSADLGIRGKSAEKTADDFRVLVSTPKEHDLPGLLKIFESIVPTSILHKNLNIA